MKRFRVIVTALAAAGLTGLALATGPIVSASTAPYATPAGHAISVGHARADFSGPCYNTKAANGAWYRCTTTSPNGGWVQAICTPGQNYNAASAPFNVYAAFNTCGYRVWLHQYTNWEGGNGWSLCTSPESGGIPNYYDLNGSIYEHPMNIYISSTTSACPGQ